MGIFAIILYLVAYLCTLINANSVENPSGRIFHGKKVTNCETYPWHAQLNFYEDSSPGNIASCGGTLISDKFILTAAHCADKCKVGLKYYVFLGSTKRFDGTEYEGTLKACYGGSHTRSYDVAIVELTERITKTNCINYLSIFDAADLYKEDLPVTAIGFGHTETTLRPDILYEATALRTINIHKCLTEKAIKSLNIAPESVNAHICTKSKDVKGQNICGGDSGGSLVYKEDGKETVLVGVTSLAPKHCNKGIGVYAKVHDPVIYQ